MVIIFRTVSCEYGDYGEYKNVVSTICMMNMTSKNVGEHGEYACCE